MSTKQENQINIQTPEFEVKVYGTSEIKQFFGLASALIDELTLQIDDECLYFKSMDKSHVSMLECVLANQTFEKWVVNKPGQFTIKTDEIYKFLKTIDRKDSVSISIRENMIVFQTKTLIQKFALLNVVSYIDQNIPRVSYNTRIILELKELKKIVKQIGLVSDYIKINMEYQKIEFSGKGDKGESIKTLEKGMPYIPEFENKENSTSNYNIALMKDFLKVLEVENIMFEFSSNNPIHFHVMLNNYSRIEYWMAPRVEN